MDKQEVRGRGRPVMPLETAEIIGSDPLELLSYDPLAVIAFVERKMNVATKADKVVDRVVDLYFPGVAFTVVDNNVAWSIRAAREIASRE